jgi:RND family efflux transporter MFP subunit
VSLCLLSATYKNLSIYYFLERNFMKHYIIVLCTAMCIALTGCRSGNKNSECSSHDGHNHEHADNHNHNHSHDDDDHGHNHEGNEKEAQGHLDEIIFTKLQAEAVGLQTETVIPAAFSQVIKTSGQIQAAQGDEVTVVATSNGIVSFATQSITEGAAVRAGETLVYISAKKLLEGDPAAKAKIDYETALKDFQRAESLIKDKIISVKEYDQTRLRYETAKNIYEAQAADVTASGVRVAVPMTGYVKSRLVSEGEYVSVGQPIAVISQNKKLQLRAEVSEIYFKSLKGIKSANFRPAYGDSVYKLDSLNGRLISVGKASGGQSFFIPVTFEFDNVGDIIPGAFAEVYLLSTPQSNVISVPASAITEEQSLHFVYLQLDDEGYKKQEVRLGQSDGTRVQILTGLNKGDKVVTRGVYQVKLAAISSVMPEGHTH